jgi:hypothetical protein
MDTRKKNIEWKVYEKGCFIITSHFLDKDGYGKFNQYGKKHFIHKYIYEECFGEVPEGMVVRHKCDNPSCINPEHLELGTQADNVADMFSRNRNPNRSNENNGRTLLTKEEVIEIRQDVKSTHVTLSKKYNVSVSCIRGIRSGRTWRNL